MNNIPDPRVPQAAPLSISKVSFRFTYLPRTGKFSFSTFKKLPKNTRSKICKKFQLYSRMSVPEFKGNSATRYGKRNVNFIKPSNISEDWNDNLWDYFRIGKEIRVFGYLERHKFYVIHIDPTHKK